MVSTVRSRPNYYELLGLAPTAAGDEITRAFVRAFSAFRPSGQQRAAEISLAYETLRDPVKRRRYNESLGLRPDPPRPAPVLARPEPRPDPLPAIAPPAPDRQYRLDSAPPARFDHAGPLEIEPTTVGWKKIATGAAIVVVSACLLGAGAGWWSGREAGQVPAAEPAPAVAEVPADPEPATPIPPSSPRQLADKAPLRPFDRPRIVQAPKVRAPEARPESAVVSAQEQVDAKVSEAAAADIAPTPVPTQAAAQALPLPHRVIARTIERIGYPCGSVTSATPVEGAAGVFRIACSSGQSYQAAPVNGRYHFRRWSKG